MIDKPFPFKTLLITCLIGALLWGCAISAICQTRDTIVQPRYILAIDSQMTHQLIINLASNKQKKYEINLPKVAGWTMATVGGIAWGAHEAKYADPRIFEKRFGVSPTSFGGSRDWESKYPGGTYDDGESPVWWKDKTNIFRESKKTTAFIGRYFPMVAGISLTLNQKRHWTDYLVMVGLYSGSAMLTYNYLRH